VSVIQELLPRAGWSAEISEDGVYRYHLRRVWDATKKRVCFGMLNPSKADGFQNDPTITRCCNFGMDWGFRATAPQELKKHIYPIGPLNDERIRLTIMDEDCGMFVAAWGRMGSIRQGAMCYLLRNIDVYIIGEADYPRHPLYLKADLQPKLWRARKD
jgi:hypothetical protein